jgi:hypothetical protein
MEAIQPAPHVAWAIDGTVLAVGTGEDSVIVDLNERQTNSVTIIDVTRGANGLVEGIHGPYVLSVEIPPRRSFEMEPEPLDAASVILRLWTYNHNTEMEAI